MGKDKKALSPPPPNVIGQCKICFNTVIGFLEIPTYLNTRLEAKTHLAVGEFLVVAKTKGGF
jgi:hypothetical protein